MTHTDVLKHKPTCTFMRPCMEKLPDYIQAIRTGMRTSTASLEEGENEEEERMEEAAVIEMDGQNFIDWVTTDEDFYVAWMYDPEGNFVGTVQFQHDHGRLVPADLLQGHAGWIVHPDHRRKGHGTSAVAFALQSMDRQHVVLKADTLEGERFITGLFPYAEEVSLNGVPCLVIHNPYTEGY